MLREISEETRYAASAAWVEAEVRRLDVEKQKGLANFFSVGTHLVICSSVVRAVAMELAKMAPKLTAAEAELRVDGGIPEHMHADIRGDGGLGVHNVPILAELRRKRAAYRTFWEYTTICKFRHMVVDMRGERVARMGSNHLRANFTDDCKPLPMHDWPRAPRRGNHARFARHNLLCDGIQ